MNSLPALQPELDPAGEVPEFLTVELLSCSLLRAPWCRLGCPGQVHPSIQMWLPDHSWAAYHRAEEGSEAWSQQERV